MATSEIVEFIGDWTGPVVATSVHAGHDVRLDLVELMVLDDAERFREEDPYTDRIAAVVSDRVLTHRSRFECDLNRPRREAIYRAPDDCWGRSKDLGCGPMDARENVAFEGRNMAWFVHDRYPRVGCVLALEFKKTFMDEWTGELSQAALDCASVALEAALPGLREELDRLR